MIQSLNYFILFNHIHFKIEKRGLYSNNITYIYVVHLRIIIIIASILLGTYIIKSCMYDTDFCHLIQSLNNV